MTSQTGPNAGRVLADDATWPGGAPVDAAAFGVRWQGPIPVGTGWAPGPTALDPRPVTVREGNVADTLPDATLLWHGHNEGGVFAAWRGPAGDVLMTHDHGGRFYLDAQGTALDVAPGADALITARTLLDSVMFTVALVRGHVLIHGSAVTDGARVIVVVGASGRGKTSLALALRARGLQHLTDDVLALQAGESTVLGHPGPPVITVPDGAGLLPSSRSLALIDGERWDAVAAAPAPLPIAGVVELVSPDREPDAAPEVVPLLSHILSVPPERARDRFVMLSLLSERCPLIRLTAHSASPAELADQILTRLEGAVRDV